MQQLKTYLLTGLLSLFACTIFAQKSVPEVTDNEWDKIIQLLMDEKWKDAEKLSQKYLKKFTEKDDSLAAPAILRYMYIRCVAAQLGDKEYDKAEALKKVEKLVGKTVLTPPREFYEKCQFNCLQLSDDKNHFYSCSSNAAMTVIHIFEKYAMEDPADIQNAADYVGKTLRIGAVIQEIKAGGFAMPRLEITFEHAFIWESE